MISLRPKSNLEREHARGFLKSFAVAVLVSTLMVFMIKYPIILGVLIILVFVGFILHVAAKAFLDVGK